MVVNVYQYGSELVQIMEILTEILINAMVAYFVLSGVFVMVITGVLLCMER